jgi:hypothetical protein
VPEVVLIESEANYERLVRSSRDELIGASRALDRLRVPEAVEITPGKLRYRKDIEQIVTEADGDILPIPNVPHSRLIERAVARRRPFDDQGRGYRDALIWENVLGLLERSPSDAVILISNDKSAFAKSKTEPILAPDLEAEVRERGYLGRVDLYLELREFTDYLPEVHARVASWRQLLRSDSTLRLALVQHLLEQARSDATTVIGASNLPPNTRNARFIDFSNPRDPSLNEVWESSDGSVILDVSLIADYRQEFEAQLPDPSAPPGVNAWMPMTQESSIVLDFAAIQHANAPDSFAGHLVGWRDPRDAGAVQP